MPWDKEDQSFKILINKRVTSDSKAFYEEVGDDTLNTHFDNVWIAGIPSDPAIGVSQGILQQVTLLTLTEDLSVSNHQSWYAYSGDRLRDWVSDKFGTSYGIQLFDSLNNQIFPTDLSQWYFSYQTGILIFNGTAPANRPLKISGYRYIGKKGVTGLQGITGLGLGATGPQGTTGVQGIQGATGAGGGGGGGTTGATGDEGPQGDPGATGPQGATGIFGGTLGTTNYLAQFTVGGFGNSLLYSDGTHIGVDSTTPTAKMTLNDGGVKLHLKPYGGAGPYSAISSDGFINLEPSPGTFPIEIHDGQIRIDMTGPTTLDIGDNGIAGVGLNCSTSLSIVANGDLTLAPSGSIITNALLSIQQNASMQAKLNFEIQDATFDTATYDYDISIGKSFVRVESTYDSSSPATFNLLNGTTGDFIILYNDGSSVEVNLGSSTFGMITGSCQMFICYLGETNYWTTVA
jgi:hypothetical protein